MSSAHSNSGSGRQNRFMGREHCRFPRAAGVQFLGRAHAAASLTMEPMSLHGWWSEIKQFTRWLLHCRMLAPIRFDRAVISPNGFSILCYMTFIYRLNDWARGHSSAHFSTPQCGMRSVYAALENRNVIKSPFIITGEQIDVLKLALRKATTAAATTVNQWRAAVRDAIGSLPRRDWNRNSAAIHFGSIANQRVKNR